LRDLEASFKDRSPFARGGPTPPRSPDAAASAASPAGSHRRPRTTTTTTTASPPAAVEPHVERAVSHLIEKDRARDGDVQRMLEMVANLQSEMAELKAQNDGAKPAAAPPEDSKAKPPDSAENAAADGPAGKRGGAWSIF